MTGRLTKDPVSNSYDSGNSIYVNFSIAVNRPNTKSEISDFFNCVAWKEKAEFISKFIRKGDLVAITGVLQTRTYEDKKTSEKRTTVEIYVEQIELLATRNKSGNSNYQNQNNKDQNNNNNDAFGFDVPEYDPPF